MSKRVLVAVSGRMDSAVAAGLLKTQGYEVRALHMRFWDSATARKLPPGGSCCHRTDIEDVQRICSQLEIPLEIVDAEEQYANDVIDYFVHEYLHARLPNPCVVCNSKLKFEILMRKADQLRCEFVATGHYAKIVRNTDGTESNLYRAADVKRDQSYYLFPLSQEWLARSVLPLGDLLEANVIKMATTFGLPVVTGRPPGQRICFVDNTGFATMVAQRSPERYRPGGPIVDVDGRTLGRHEGLYGYRIGQTNVPGVDQPGFLAKFVIGFDLKFNALILGDERDLMQSGLLVGACNWIGLQDFTRGLKATARFRSHQTEDATCIVTLLNNNSALVEFEKPQIAIMPGQAIVFYQDDLVIGGGWIESPLKPATTKLNKRVAFTISEKS